MANTIDSIVPKILARGMLSLREKALMPRLVSNDFSVEAAQKGDSIEVPVSGKVTVSDVTPGATPPDPGDTTTTSHTITLGNWKKASFHLTDRDIMRIDADRDFIPFQLADAVSALADSVNASFMSEVRYAAHIIGRGNTMLFAKTGNDANADFYGPNPAIVSRRMLNKSLAPKEGRYGILGYEQEASALALAEFADAEKSGDSGVRIEGEIGRKYGINWFASANTYRHVGNRDTNFQLAKTYQAGEERVSTVAITGTLEDGDIIALQNGLIPVASVKTYLGSAVYSLASPLSRNITSSTGLSTIMGHDNSVVFHRDAFAFATRPLASMTEEYGFGNRILSVTDPVSGLSLRLEVSRQYKQTVWELDILWGVKLVRPEFLVRMISQ